MKNCRWFLLGISSLIYITCVPFGTLSAKDLSFSSLRSYLNTYENIVFKNYTDSHKDALKLRKAVDNFIKHPSEYTMSIAKKSWL